VNALKTANLALKFLLELAAIAAFAAWGASVGSGAGAIALAIAAAAIAILLWGVFAAPRSTHRLPRAARVPFELAVFALAAAALLEALDPVAAIVFGSLAIVNVALMTILGQWDE
jgi:hypothetical protein